MLNKKIKVNKKTFEWLKKQIPSDMTPFNIITHAARAMTSIVIEIDDELEDNVIKIEEDVEDERQ